MINILKIGLVFLCLIQVNSINSQKISLDLNVDSLFDSTTETYHTYATYLPESYSDSINYPLLIVFDGSWMFEPTVMQVKTLSDLEIIPPTIVVGVYHKDRSAEIGLDWNSGQFSETSKNYAQFLMDAILKKIEKIYSVSTFKGLVGHSNGATFAHQMVQTYPNYFDGVIGISQHLFGNQISQWKNLVLSDQIHYYFSASGLYDAPTRLETGLFMDSIYHTYKDAYLKFKNVVYPTDHMGLVGHGLGAGILHLFSDYRHFNDGMEVLIDSIVDHNLSVIDFMEDHKENIKSIYGVSFTLKQEDYYFMQSTAQSIDEIEAVMEYEKQERGIGPYFYALYAQDFERIKAYDEALDMWHRQLQQMAGQNISFFYYRRPLRLAWKKMKDPNLTLKLIDQYLKDQPNSIDLHQYRLMVACKEGIKVDGLPKSIGICLDQKDELTIFSAEEIMSCKNIFNLD